MRACWIGRYPIQIGVHKNFDARLRLIGAQNGRSQLTKTVVKTVTVERIQHPLPILKMMVNAAHAGPRAAANIIHGNGRYPLLCHQRQRRRQDSRLPYRSCRLPFLLTH